MTEQLLADIKKELEAAITKNLPEAVGSELKKLLTQAEKDADQVKNLSEIIKDLTKDLQNRNLEITELKTIVHKHVDLDKRQREIKEREDNIKIHDREEKLKATELRQYAVENLVQIVFRNPQKVLEISKSSNIPVTHNGYTTTVNSSEFTTQTEREVP